ncbi:hypothetical protein ACFXPX_38465 [Kitasatospora sp. NPDC059146]|uniref:hypothetical protein n=1 Tax=unclassified Kitasatospora TaxID=2633591 RepID=UPI003675E2C8
MDSTFTTTETPTPVPPTADVTVAFTATGDPVVHVSDCGHHERRTALSTAAARQMKASSWTDVAVILFGDTIAESGLTPFDYADELSIASCALRIPHGAPDGKSRWTRQRREQGFQSREHFEAALAHWAHTAACAECRSPGPSVLTDDGWQGTANVCPEGQRLFDVESAFSPYR